MTTPTRHSLRRPRRGPMSALDLNPGGTSAFDHPGAGPDVTSGGLWRSAWRRLRRNPTAIAGALIIFMFVVIAVIAPLLTPYEPASTQWSGDVTPTHVPGPSADHLLGLDRFGSDLYTQMLFGARQSLVYGVVSTLIGLTFGALLGVLAGGLGGWVDTAVMRLVDIMLAVPSLLLAVSIAAILGQNAYSIMIAIGVAQVPIVARLLRGSMLAQGRSDYVLAANALGLRTPQDRHGPHAAQRARPDDRAGDAEPRDRDHRGGGAVLPRPRRLRPGDRRVGPDAGGGAGPLPDGPPARALARRRDRHHRPRLHAVRRGTARGARPEDAEVSR